jgi:ankyrin repeat protein
LTENVTCIKRWLSKNAAFKMTFYNHDSQLFYAGWSGDLETIQALRRVGQNFTVRDGDGNTVFHWAVENMHIEVVRVLLSITTERSYYPLQSNNYGHTPFHSAAYSADDDMIRLLASSGADVARTCGERGVQAIHMAGWNAKSATLKTLEDVGVDICKG